MIKKTKFELLPSLYDNNKIRNGSNSGKPKTCHKETRRSGQGSGLPGDPHGLKGAPGGAKYCCVDRAKAGPSYHRNTERRARSLRPRLSQPANLHRPRKHQREGKIAGGRWTHARLHSALFRDAAGRVVRRGRMRREERKGVPRVTQREVTTRHYCLTADTASFSQQVRPKKHVSHPLINQASHPFLAIQSPRDPVRHPCQ